MLKENNSAAIMANKYLYRLRKEIRRLSYLIIKFYHYPVNHIFLYKINQIHICTCASASV